MTEQHIQQKLTRLLTYPEARVKFDAIAKALAKVHTIQLVARPKPPKTKTKAKSGSQRPILSDYPHFRAASGEVVEAPGRWFVGIGVVGDIDNDLLGAALMKLASRMATSLQRVQILVPPELEKQVGVENWLNLFVTAVSMATYPVDFLKGNSAANNIKLKHVSMVTKAANVPVYKKALRKYSILGRHVNGARQVQSLPGNYMTATSMEKRARNMARKFGLKVKVLKQTDLERIGAGGILAVNRGSQREPRLIVLEYNPSTRAKKTLGLVGKGVTFDTGGVSLKPSSEMHEMKYDMGGAAAVVHAIGAIAELKLPVRAVGVVGMVENMPDGAAFKPGDVYTSLKGVTVEVQNTDAEGRMVLGDLLHYCEKHYKPDLMVDLATLTGAIVVALGPYYAGLFSPGEKVRKQIEAASAASLEPVWPMPIGPRYKELLKSDIADFNNIGGRYGGSSSAASFLSVFVDRQDQWAHLDIAGIGFMKKSFNVYPSVATGFGVRLLAALAENLK